MASERRDWGLLDVLDAFAAGERSPHVWASASGLATVIRREARGPFGQQRLEQTLTSTQREELAALLRYACYRTLHRIEGLNIAPARNPDGTLWRTRDEHWSLRQEALARAAGQELSPRHALLQESREAGWTAGTSAKDLALASLHICDHSTSRIYLALAEIAGGEARRGLEAVQHALARAATPLSLTEALVVVGYAEAAMGRRQDALLSYRRAAGQGMLGAVPGFAWLALAALVGAPEEVEPAAWAFSDHVSGPTESADLVTRWIAANGGLVTTPTDGVLQLLAREKLPAEAHTVVGAIFDHER